MKLVIILRIAPTKWPVLGPKLLSTGDSIKSSVIKKRNSESNMATNCITFLRKRIYLFYVCDFFCLCLCLQSSEEGIRHSGMGWAWLVGWGLSPGPLQTSTQPQPPVQSYSVDFSTRDLEEVSGVGRHTIMGWVMEYSWAQKSRW